MLFGCGELNKDTTDSSSQSQKDMMHIFINPFNSPDLREALSSDFPKDIFPQARVIVVPQFITSTKIWEGNDFSSSAILFFHLIGR